MKLFITISLATITTLAPTSSLAQVETGSAVFKAPNDDIIVTRPCVPWRKCDKHLDKDTNSFV